MRRPYHRHRSGCTVARASIFCLSSKEIRAFGVVGPVDAPCIAWHLRAGAAPFLMLVGRYMQGYKDALAEVLETKFSQVIEGKSKQSRKLKVGGIRMSLSQLQRLYDRGNSALFSVDKGRVPLADAIMAKAREIANEEDLPENRVLDYHPLLSRKGLKLWLDFSPRQRADNAGERTIQFIRQLTQRLSHAKSLQQELVEAIPAHVVREWEQGQRMPLSLRAMAVLVRYVSVP
jgi:hypothetical protein